MVHAAVGFAIKDAWRNNWLLLESAAGVKKVNYGVVAHWSPSHQPNTINLVKVWGKVRHAVPEISLRTDRKTDTHTQTHRHAHHNTLALPGRGNYRKRILRQATMQRFCDRGAVSGNLLNNNNGPLNASALNFLSSSARLVAG